MKSPTIVSQTEVDGALIGVLEGGGNRKPQLLEKPLASIPYVG